jgi:hypothetical protein
MSDVTPYLDETLRNTQEKPKRAKRPFDWTPYLDESPTLKWLYNNGFPITRKNFIEMTTLFQDNYDWTDEDEAALPAPLRRKRREPPPSTRSAPPADLGPLFAAQAHEKTERCMVAIPVTALAETHE